MATQTNIVEQATFAGGCFWCTEAVFQRLKGVERVTSGYTGGKRENPSYEQVSTGVTGHAESIQITFDPAVIPYERLLDIFWATHDPTSLNQQGADIGTQYRSMIVYHTDEQKKKALTSKEKAQKDYSEPIVTQIVPFEAFYPAEEYHQNFYNTNPVYPYCTVVINPKIQKLLEKFGNDVKNKYRQ
jgi:peptide-methionine (S)-S-oxide reductase